MNQKNDDINNFNSTPLFRDQMDRLLSYDLKPPNFWQNEREFNRRIGSVGNMGQPIRQPLKQTF